MSKTRKLTISALFIALYIVLMYFNQAFAFGAIQVRVATALYALNWIFPFLIIPSALANMLSNILFGGLGPIDAIGGAIVGIVTAGSIVLLKKQGMKDILVVLPITFVPGIGVPLYLSKLLELPLLPLIASLIVGQAIAAFCGWILIKALQKHTYSTF